MLHLLIGHAVVGSWVTHEEGGGDWTIDLSGKTTYENKDYGPKYYIKEDPTGVLRRGDGWVSGPESTVDRLVWTLENKDGELQSLVWTRQNNLKLQQGPHSFPAFNLAHQTIDPSNSSLN